MQILKDPPDIWRSFFSINGLCVSALTFVLSGCGSCVEVASNQLEKQPFISIFLLDSNLFRLVGGFSGESGLTHKFAIKIAQTFCANRASNSNELKWSVRPFDAGGENGLRVGSFDFSCTSATVSPTSSKP